MDNGSQALIRLENVSKVFVTDEVETHALSSVHFELKKGEYLSIAGPSGCGKSTLLAILGLLDTPSDGTYYLNGKPVTGLKLSERARIRNREIGFIFQAFNLIGDLTVYENVELPLTYRGMPSSERKRRVQEALERVGMSHRMKHYPSQLSGGQQQRVAVARALSGDTLILLADEPTGNLDSVNSSLILELFVDLNRRLGQTIVMITHNLEAAQVGHRIIEMRELLKELRNMKKTILVSSHILHEALLAAPDAAMLVTEGLRRDVTVMHWSRRVYIAGELPNTPENLTRWLQHPPQVEPKTAMPDMGVTDQDSRDIAAYLYSLK